MVKSSVSTFIQHLNHLNVNGAFEHILSQFGQRIRVASSAAASQSSNGYCSGKH